MTETLRKILTVTFIIGVLIAIGVSLNAVIPWIMLAYFFKAIKFLLIPFDFIIDTQVLTQLITISFVFEVSIFIAKSWKALMTFTGWNK